jgi:hypothetical protein
MQSTRAVHAHKRCANANSPIIVSVLYHIRACHRFLRCFLSRIDGTHTHHLSPLTRVRVRARVCAQMLRIMRMLSFRTRMTVRADEDMYSEDRPNDDYGEWSKRIAWTINKGVKVVLCVWPLCFMHAHIHQARTHKKTRACMHCTSDTSHTVTSVGSRGSKPASHQHIGKVPSPGSVGIHCSGVGTSAILHIYDTRPGTCSCAKPTWTCTLTCVQLNISAGCIQGDVSFCSVSTYTLFCHFLKYEPGGDRNKQYTCRWGGAPNRPIHSVLIAVTGCYLDRFCI